MDALALDSVQVDRQGHTIEDVYALPDGKRAEVIDGQWYDMATPSTIHQEIVMALSAELRSHIRSKGGDCKVLPAPFSVLLNQDNRTYVEPDISVVCDQSKLNERGCNGAPDLIIEVLSPSTKRKDLVIKRFKYRAAGVREYWTVNPDARVINTHVFNEDFEKEEADQFSFEEPVICSVFPEFSVVMREIL